MRKICILAYWYPPLRAIGSLRPAGFAAHARENGFKATVITIDNTSPLAPRAQDPIVPLPDVVVHRVPAFDMNEAVRLLFRPIGVGHGRMTAFSTRRASCGRCRRVLASVKDAAQRFYSSTLAFPDAQAFWGIRAWSRILEIIAKEQPEVVFATSSPFSALLLGARIKRRFPEVVYIADYRDLWASSAYLNRLPFLHGLDGWLEARATKAADLVTTTSEEIGAVLQSKYPAAKVECVYNGYDLPLNTESVPTEKFTILHAGMIYPGRRDPSMLFEAVSRLRASGRVATGTFTILFVGSKIESVGSIAATHGVADLVSCHPSVPHDLVMRTMKSACMLLLLQWVRDTTAVPGKLFEYIGMRLPILAIATVGGEIDRLLRRAGCGRVYASAEEMAREIEVCYGLWLQNRRNRLISDREAVAPFSREAQARRLYQLAKAILTCAG